MHVYAVESCSCTCSFINWNILNAGHKAKYVQAEEVAFFLLTRSCIFLYFHTNNDAHGKRGCDALI